MYLVKRILIVTTDVKFGLSTKKGLERTGEYQVTVFSSGTSAVDYVRQNKQDLVLIDFRIRDMPGTDMIDHMRAMQPHIAIIAAPNHPAVQELKVRYHIQEIVNIPIRLRTLIGIIENALTAFQDDQPDTALTPSVNMTDTARIVPSPMLEFWLADVNGDTVIERTPPEDEPEPDIEASATFYRLAAEEPPMPNFEQGGTVNTLRDQLEKEQFPRVVHDDEYDTEPNPPEETGEDSRGIPAALILETALDDSTPIRSFSLQEFITQVTERGVPEIEPLPSWLKESERYIREPDFLVDEIEELTGEIEYDASVTLHGNLEAIEDDPGNLVTDPIEPVQRSKPPTSIPEIEKPVAEPDETVIEDVQEETEVAPPSIPELEPVAKPAPESIPELPFTEYDRSDPQLAQLATTLTQVALELTADATVLARDGKIAAYAGKLPPSDIEALHEHLTIKWDKENETDKSRILFATVPESGTEYMISTRGTDFGFTLSLIFSGTRPLQDIRRQSKRLAEALTAIPELEPEPEPVVLEAAEPNIAIPSTDEIGVRLPITFLWLLRDAQSEIPSAVQKQIIKTLDIELTQAGWKIADIHAPSYIYIQGDIPVSLNPRETLGDLMSRVAVIINDSYPSLADEKIWHDSYLILQPGREMRQEEIQRFITFARR